MRRGIHLLVMASQCVHQFIDERHVPERADEIENAQAANLRSYWGLSEFGVGLGPVSRLVIVRCVAANDASSCAAFIVHAHAKTLGRGRFCS